LANPVTHASCGLVTLTVAAKGAFSGVATIGGTKFGIRGVFDADGVARFGTATEATLPRAGLSPLLLRLNLPTGNVTPLRIFGDVREAGGFTALIDAPRVLFTAAAKPLTPLRNPPLDWRGIFNADLAVTAATVPTGLDGYGWGSAKVGADGMARFSGLLADGSKWSSAQPLVADGTVPIYVALYGGKGSIFGLAQFAGSPVTVTSSLTWFRPPKLAGARFVAGWPDGIPVTLSGGVWTRYAAKVSWPLPGLGATAGAAHLWVNGGGLAPSLDWAVAFALDTGRATVAAAPAGASATFTAAAATGLFTGAFKTTPNAAPVAFSGVLVPGANRARGFFLAPTGSGAVLLRPQ
jgi:hypothetical protein